MICRWSSSAVRDHAAYGCGAVGCGLRPHIGFQAVGTDYGLGPVCSFGRSVCEAQFRSLSLGSMCGKKMNAGCSYTFTHSYSCRFLGLYIGTVAHLHFLRKTKLSDEKDLGYEYIDVLGCDYLV